MHLFSFFYWKIQRPAERRVSCLLLTLFLLLLKKSNIWDKLTLNKVPFSNLFIINGGIPVNSKENQWYCTLNSEKFACYYSLKIHEFYFLCGKMTNFDAKMKTEFFCKSGWENSSVNHLLTHARRSHDYSRYNNLCDTLLCSFDRSSYLLPVLCQNRYTLS